MTEEAGIYEDGIIKGEVFTIDRIRMAINDLIYFYIPVKLPPYCDLVETNRMKMQDIALLEMFLEHHNVHIPERLTGAKRLRYIRRRVLRILWWKYRWHRRKDGVWVGEVGHTERIK